MLNMLQDQGTRITTAHVELPSTRVQPSRPFLTTGVNCWSHLTTTGTNMQKTIRKDCIIIFICFVKKAVHVDVVTSLTTQAFLAALRRFRARRGKTKKNLLIQWY
jgi:hypothetical protein